MFRRFGKGKEKEEKEEVDEIQDKSNLIAELYTNKFGVSEENHLMNYLLVVV